MTKITDHALAWLADALIMGNATWGGPLDELCLADAESLIGWKCLTALCDEIVELRAQAVQEALTELLKRDAAHCRRWAELEKYPFPQGDTQTRNKLARIIDEVARNNFIPPMPS